MRRTSFIVPAALALVLWTSGCGDTPTQVPSAVAPSPSLSMGAEIDVLPSVVSFILTFDPERELLSAHMPSDLGPICGGSEPLNTVWLQRVTTPSEIDQVARLLKGSGVRVAVYDAASPADAGFSTDFDSFGFFNLVDADAFCSFLSGPGLIAEGDVDRVQTVTNASFHVRWSGRIAGVDGRDYHLTEIYQLNADAHDPSNPDTFTEPVVDILLRPIG